jgi:pyruvate formate lyase activating enzyme
MSVAQIIARVEEDGVFYSRSGGGLTLGGGDPLYQPEFTARLLAEAKRRRIHTALETCGFVRWDLLAEACRHLDVLLYDIKSTDPEKHKAFTGRSNRTILENLKRVRQGFPELPIVVRTPLIPGFNDSEAQIAAILERINTMPGVTYEALSYHRLGMPKYESLGRPYALGERRPSSRLLRRIRKLIDEFNQQKTAEGG